MRHRRGISSIIGTIFFVLILIIALTMFTTIFNSFSAYQNAVNQKEQAEIQNGQTQLTAAMQFGSPIVPSGSSNPPAFNVNSIGSSTVQTDYPFERKIVYSQGLWWAFYSSGTAIVYQTSSDGITWSATQTLSTAAGDTASYDLSVWLGSNNVLYFVLAEYGTATSFTVESVPLQSSGTVGTATTVTQNLPSTSTYTTEGYDSITNDTSGNIWVAVNAYYSTTGDRYALVYRCTSTLSSCTFEESAPGAFEVGADDIVPMLVGLSNGAIVVMYATSGSGTAQTFTTAEAFHLYYCTPGTTTTRCQGTSTTAWTSVGATSAIYYPDHVSAVGIGTSVYFAGASSSGVVTWSYPYAGSISAVTTIDSSVISTAEPVSISEDGTGTSLSSSNYLVVFYGATTTVYLTTSTTDTSWTAKQTVSTSENSLLGISTPAWEYIDGGVEVGAIWSSGSASPYTVRFGEVNIQSYNPTMLSPSTVSTSTTDTATSSPSENKLFYNLGLWWDFFAVGTGIDYATSVDGLVWSSPTSVITSATYSGAATGSDFSLDYSGNTVCWALSSGDSAATFDYNSGTLSSSGTITFGTVATISTSTGYTSYGPISLGIDASGNAWVALTTLQSGTTYYIEVYEHASGAANTVWSSNIAPTNSLTATADGVIDGLQTGSGAVLIAETSGTTGTGAISIYSTTGSSGWTSSTWTSAVSPPSDYALPSSSEDVVGATLAFAGLASTTVSQTSGTLNFWTFVIGGSATSTEQEIETTSASWQASLGVYGGTLFLFDATGSTLSYYYTGNLGNTWSPKIFATTYEPNIAGLSASDGGTFAVTWTNGNPSVGSFNVRFASLSSLSVTNNSPTAIHIVSLYVANPATNSLIADYFTNSTELFDYWIGAGSSVTLAFSFPWSTTTSYALTFATSTGIVESQSFTSPA